MNVYVDIDNTICTTKESDYSNSTPRCEQIKKINKLYDEGNKITYWTARGGHSGKDWTQLTKQQLQEWGCNYHNLIMNNKPSYDLLICDKTKRIEEI
tara:strand:+ start:183 stop:473 length:291 start_codon:yes stop_codon:yes gene_type:complete